MSIAGFITAILVGYSAMSFGVMKIFWRLFGVHFYEPGVAHAPQASFPLDTLLIAILFAAGVSLVMYRGVIFCLVIVMATYMYEFGFLHDGRHELWQYLFVSGSLAFQLTAFLLNVRPDDLDYFENTRSSSR